MTHAATMDPTAQRVTTRPHHDADRAALERDLSIADRLSELLDSKFSIGGIRFGYDSLIGLLPGIGDVATGVVGLYPVYLAGRHNLGGWTVLRMLGNVALDLLLGLLPIVGDAGDLLFKSNRRNYRLLREAAEKRLRRR